MDKMSSSHSVSVMTAPTLAQNQLTINDDGNGGLMMNGIKIDGGSVNYQTGTIRLPKRAFATGNVVSQDYQDFALQQGGKPYSAVSGSQNTQNYQIIAPREAQLAFISAPDTRPISDTVQNGSLTFDLLADVAYPRAVILNSWAFDVDGTRIIERDGTLYQNWDATKGSGKVVGSLNAISGVMTLTHIAADRQPVVKVLQGIYTQGDFQTKQFYGRTAVAPIKPQSFTVYAETGDETLQGKAQADETLSGSLKGKIAYKTGFFTVESTQAIPPDALRYNAVAQSSLPLDSTIIGINANRLPLDGKVPVFRKGDMIVIGNTHEQGIGSAHIAGQVIELQRKNIDRLCVLDANDKHINAELYDADLKKGKLTWATPLNLAEYAMPLKTKQIWEESNRLTDVDVVSGSLKLQFGVSRDYPIEKTYVSSAIVGGNMEVRATQPFSQQAWTQVWQDTRIGDPILANLNVADYPIVLTSDGAITERWLMRFKNTTQFQLFGERLGLVAESDIYTDLAPINPATQKPYFKLPALAMGGGFATQNCVRFNTTGTPLPVWVVRAVQPSPNREIQRDGFAICLRGNTIELD